ncbi:hypothetical protein OTB20_06205 [Streptomyces sp. H27-H1]|uniref:hypothetical protein n=1 Tax=Streptomyces sp. H27-H1 TaxID=2996461 RepID=UPI00226E0F43|nr:hypothetical protein [Streptomyces sp. H27-H1]MCY0925801.1 hypothetical protein [Streptomyces sp. H27-H1]
MTELIILFLLMGLAGLYAVVKVMRRERRRHSETADGVRIELERTAQLRKDRTTYSSNSVHNNPFTTGL